MKEMAEENEYEQQRAKRIARNAQVLQELGITNTKTELEAGVVARPLAKRRRVVQTPEDASEPTRRSRRIAGQAAPPEAGATAVGGERGEDNDTAAAATAAPGRPGCVSLGSRLPLLGCAACSLHTNALWLLLLLSFRRCQPVNMSAALQVLNGKGSSGDPLLDAHNLMRCRTMSEKALRTRIWRIRRAGKLASFIRVLRALGHEELEAEARQAFADLTGCNSSV